MKIGAKHSPASIARISMSLRGRPTWNKGIKGIHLSLASEWKPNLGAGLGPDHPNWKPPLQRICEYCSKPFERKPWRVTRPGHGGRFCSLPCYRQYKSLHESGLAAKDWVGGEKTYRGRDWKRKRLEVVEIQKGKCANCGVYVGPSLPVNHIQPFRDFLLPEVANHKKNLVGLCQSCHMKLEWQVRKTGS